MKKLILSLSLLCSLSLGAAVLQWEDLNNPVGTLYVISNKVNNGPWMLLGTTLNKTSAITLSPGTNWFSLSASNGLISEPTSTSTNMPYRVFNIIIQGKNDFQEPWMTETNMVQFMTTVEDKRWYRLLAEIK